MTDYAVGRRAYGFCERCAFRWPLGDLKAETYKGIDKHNRVCPDCWDEENPQVFVGDYQFDDPQSLKRPAPDLGLSLVNEFETMNVRPSGMYSEVQLGGVVAGEWYAYNLGSTVKKLPGVGIGDGRSEIQVTETFTSDLHAVSASINVNLANNITFSAYVKGLTGLRGPGSESDQFVLRGQDASGANVFTQVFFYNGTYAGLGFSSGTYTDLGYTITTAANGFVLATMTFNLGGGSNPAVFFIGNRPVALGTASYAGTGKTVFSYIDQPVITNP